MRFSWLCFLLLAGSLVTNPAEAWTRTHVRTAKAEVTPRPDGVADVLLSLGVEVEGGWLERLDLPGFDEDLEVQSARLITADGLETPAEVQAKQGELSVRFARGAAPRRGLHRLEVRYTTVLLGQRSHSLPDGRVRLAQGLPGWEAGLTEGELAWLVPSGSEPVRDPESAQDVRREPAVGGQVRLRFVRAHVPRTTPWSVAVDVPESFFGAGHVAAEARRRASSPDWTHGAGLTALLAFLAYAAFQVRARLWRRIPRLSAWPRRLGFALCSAVAVACFGRVPAVCVVALLGLPLVLADKPGPDAVASLGRFAPLTRKLLLRASLRRRGWTTLRLACLALPCPVLWLVPAEYALFLATGLVSMARLAGFDAPRSVDEQVCLLARAAGSLVTVGTALRLMWYVPSTGSAHAPRLRIVPFARYPGLLRVELAVDARRERAPLVLMVVAETGSPVDQWLDGPGGDLAGLRGHAEQSEGGLRTAHFLRVTEPTEDIDALFARLAAESQKALTERLAEAA